MQDADLDGLRGARRRRAEHNGAEDRRQHENELPGVHGFGSPRPGRTCQPTVQLRDHLARRGDGPFSVVRAAAAAWRHQTKSSEAWSAPTKTSRSVAANL